MESSQYEVSEPLSLPLEGANGTQRDTLGNNSLEKSL
jgi:hypothetical protein